MSSAGVNVLRWSALGLGIFYGFSHQRSITATQKAAHDKHEFEKKQKVIDTAKAEFAKRHPAPSTGSKDLVTDPSDPKFDLEKLLLKVSEDKA